MVSSSAMMVSIFLEGFLAQTVLRRRPKASMRTCLHVGLPATGHCSSVISSATMSLFNLAIDTPSVLYTFEGIPPSSHPRFTLNGG